MLFALTVLPKRRNAWGAAFMFLFFCFGLLHAQDVCKEALEETEEAFDKKQFAHAVEILNPCLPEAIGPREHSVRAYELLALSHYELQQYDLADSAITKLLNLNGKYSAGPGVAENFKTLVEEVRKRINVVSETPRRQVPKWTWWVNGAAAIASGVVIYYVFKEDPPAPIGDPPVPPKDQLKLKR